MTSRGLARPIEIAASVAGLVLTLPILLVVAALVAATSPGPILFRHPRAGLNGRPFEMLKFRTMRQSHGGPEVTAHGDARVTPVGRMLRTTKLDELPELWNVLRGEMSLVGPRPESLQYASAATPEWREVLSVRPGITDPVTLQLRNEEDLLAAAGPRYETFYRRYLLPYKLLGYREYLAGRTWRRDVAVLVMTMVVVVFPRFSPAPSRHDIVARVRRAGASRAMRVDVPREEP